MPVRKYYPIWEQLKASVTGKTSIAAPKQFHTRIIKAVRKEKDMDLGQKVLLAERGKKEILTYSVSGSKVTFILKRSIGLEDL